MSKIRVRRHNHYIKWELPVSFSDSPYPAEAALIERLRASSTVLFHPYPFAYMEDDRYHYYLAFLIEAVELFPLHLDLAFDAIWRAFEALCRDDVPWTAGKSVKQFTPILASTIAGNSIYHSVLDEILSAIPVQSCEYLVSRIFSDWPPNTDNSKDSTLIMKRVGFGPGNPPVPAFPGLVSFLSAVAVKYGAPRMTLDIKRRAATLLKIAIVGKLVTVNSFTFHLTLAERVSLLISALLYTFRNDRFHANVQPPFKSSKGTLKTYAHVHYCFMAGHMLLLFGLVEAGIIPDKHLIVRANVAQNLAVFLAFYDRHLNK